MILSTSLLCAMEPVYDELEQYQGYKRPEDNQSSANYIEEDENTDSIVVSLFPEETETDNKSPEDIRSVDDTFTGINDAYNLTLKNPREKVRQKQASASVEWLLKKTGTTKQEQHQTKQYRRDVELDIEFLEKQHEQLEKDFNKRKEDLMYEEERIFIWEERESEYNSVPRGYSGKKKYDEESRSSKLKKQALESRDRLKEEIRSLDSDIKSVENEIFDQNMMLTISQHSYKELQKKMDKLSERVYDLSEIYNPYKRIVDPSLTTVRAQVAKKAESKKTSSWWSCSVQ